MFKVKIYEVMGFQVLLVPCPIPVPLCLITRMGIVIHPDRSEFGVRSILELCHPLVDSVGRSGQLHCNNDKSILVFVVI